MQEDAISVVPQFSSRIRRLNSQNFVQQGVEPEGFPLLLQSLKMDSPVKDMRSSPNKQLYGGKTRHQGDVGSLFNRLHLQSSLSSPSSDLVERSLGVRVFQLAKGLVDKVISVR